MNQPTSEQMFKGFLPYIFAVSPYIFVLLPYITPLYTLQPDYFYPTFFIEVSNRQEALCAIADIGTVMMNTHSV
jgi:hypothetical protein